MNFNNGNNYRPTQYDVVVGAAGNLLTSVGPGNSGQLLQSKGNSNYPAYTTATYPSVAGTSGNILTSDGTNFISSNAFKPNSELTLYDDFFSALLSSTFISGQLTWNITTTNQWTQALGLATNQNPGVIGHSAMTTLSRSLILGTGSVVGGILIGAGSITVNWVFKIANLSTATNRYTLNLGLGNVVASSTITNGCWFQYSDNINSGNWTLKTASAGATTTSNSSAVVTSAWHNAQITINAAGTLVTFVMDGVSLGTIALTIPTTGILPLLSIIHSAGAIAQQSILVDLFYLKQILTTAR
jgi:hypothetical protein